MATILALRVSGRGEGVEQCPVGLAGIEQRPDSVVGEVGEPERGPFDAFDEIVGVWVPIIRSWALTRGFALHPGTRNRYKIRYTRTQHRPPSRHVNGHDGVSGTLWVPIIRSWALTRGFALHPGTRNRYEIRYTRTQHRPASRHVNDHGRVSGTHKLAAGRGKAVATAPSRARSSSASADRWFCRRRTASGWRSTMISRSFERPERTAKRANDPSNRYRTRHMEPQDASASCLVSAHDHILGTHTPR